MTTGLAGAISPFSNAWTTWATAPLFALAFAAALVCAALHAVAFARRLPDDADARSAVGALLVALSVQLRLLAPFLPYATEEVWSWWQGGSVHRAAWPTSPVAPGLDAADPTVAAATVDALVAVRRVKSTAKRSAATPVTRLVVRDSPERLAAVRRAEQDLLSAAGATQAVVTWEESDQASVEVELAAPA